MFVGSRWNVILDVVHNVLLPPNKHPVTTVIRVDIHNPQKCHQQNVPQTFGAFFFHEQHKCLLCARCADLIAAIKPCGRRSHHHCQQPKYDEFRKLICMCAVSLKQYWSEVLGLTNIKFHIYDQSQLWFCLLASYQNAGTQLLEIREYLFSAPA